MTDTHIQNNNIQIEPHKSSIASRQQEAGYARLAAVATPASWKQDRPINILRLPDVMRRVGLKHASIYQRITEGTFPKQISLGGRAVGWIEHEIDAWLAARIYARQISDKDRA